GGYKNIARGLYSFAAGRGAKASNNGSFVWGDDSTGVVSSSANNQFSARASGGVIFYSTSNLSTGVTLPAGSGSWSSLSDRSVKAGVVGIDDAAILAKVVALPVTEWSYAAQGSGIRHVGPMAQDFHAVFGVGEDDRHIATVDESGVALAAIKALHAENVALRRQLTRTDARLARQDDEITSLRTELARLVTRLPNGTHHRRLTARAAETRI
ncbi:MAG: tail fiber domain-containing protein, partial [Candidatus Eremiobacteraeota bacterium]|nr:tail fiber domain-containing protein [Candidatus Eremiobacteraeota bacterium]